MTNKVYPIFSPTKVFLKKIISVVVALCFVQVQCSAYSQTSSLESPVSSNNTAISVDSPSVEQQTSYAQLSQHNNYSGSQATYKGLQFNESVNENTGDLNLKYPLIDAQIPGIQYNLSLNLSYSTARSQYSGESALPSGWGFDLPYLDLTDPSRALVRFNGTSYTEDYNWKDSEGYSSGLRYVNNRGVSFQRYQIPQSVNLDETHRIFFNYSLKFVDGSLVYFDGFGKIIAKTTRFKNYILYTYFDQGNFYSSRLKEIRGSLYNNQVISFLYDGSGVTVRYPNGSQTKLFISNNKLVQIQNTLGESTALSYDNPSLPSFVTSIVYANGLHSIFKFNDSLTIGNCGSKTLKPVVTQVLHQDKSLGNSLVSDTHYKYGATTGHNYSGFPNISSCPKNDEDMLMESNNFDFRYEVDVIQTGNIHTLGFDLKTAEQKNLTKTTRTFYNFLHLPVRTEVYLSNSTNIPTYTTENKYNLTRDIHKMSSSYTQPISSETFVYDKGNHSYKPYSYSENAYDAYGNTISSTQFNYNIELQKWQPIESKTSSYYHIPSNDYSLLQQEDTFDFITGKTYETRYALTNDKKEIGARSEGVLDSQDQFQPITTQYFSYDIYGRVVSDITRCVSTVNNMCSVGVTNLENRFSYLFNSETGILEIQKIDAKNQNWITQVDTSIGKTISQISPSGKVLSAMSYDLLGRVISEKIPALTANDVKQKLYTYFSYQKNGFNKIEEKYDNGYVLGRVYDAMDREIEKFDNFYPENDANSSGSISSEYHRILSATQYNAFGTIDTTKDQFNQSTTYLYDSDLKQIATLDPDGNLKTLFYDNVNRTETAYLNGAKIAEVQKDNQDKEISKKIFPNPNYSCIPVSPYSCNSIGKAEKYGINTTQTVYDGLGREIKKIKYYSENGVNSGFDVTETSYNVLGKPSSVVFVGHDGVSESRFIYYDMLGNQVYFTKQKQVNGKLLPSYTSEKYQYDELSNLDSMVRQDGKIQKFEYNSDGQLVQKVNFSGVVHQYSYYANNLLKSDTINVPLLSYTRALSFFNKNVSYESIKSKFQTLKSFFVSENNKTASMVVSQAFGQWEKDFNEFSSFNSLNYTYNDEGSLTTVAYGNGSTVNLLSSINYNYLSDGKTLKNIVYPNGNTLLYTYDHFGRVLSFTDIKGNITANVYDDQSGHPERLKQIMGGTQNDTVNFNYFSDNEANENGIYGALKNKQLFTANGVLLNTTEQVTDAMFRNSSTVKYNEKGVLLQSVNSYNSYEQLTQVQYISSLSPTQSSNYTLNYVYDSSGVLLNFQRKNNAGNVVYGEQYDLDSNFNVTQRDIYINGELTKSMTYNYNNFNQLVSYLDNQSQKNFALEYDVDGRMIKDDLGNSYTYENFTDKIIQITNSQQALVAQYSYYPNGKRMAKMTPQSQAIPTSFFYNRKGNISNELQTSSSGDSLVSYLYDGKNSKVSRNISDNSKSESTYYANTLKVTDKIFQNNENLLKVTKNYYYSPYGEQLDEHGQSLTQSENYTLADNPYAYENQSMTDKESGLILLDARFYNPRLMRFMSQDTFGVDNKYSYTEGDPVGYADPSGHMSANQALKLALNATLLFAAALSFMISLPSCQPQLVFASSASIAKAVMGVASAVMSVTSFSLTIASLTTEGKVSANLALSAGVFLFASALFSLGSSVASSSLVTRFAARNAAKAVMDPTTLSAEAGMGANGAVELADLGATAGAAPVVASPGQTWGGLFKSFINGAAEVSKELKPWADFGVKGVVFATAIYAYSITKFDTPSKKVDVPEKNSSPSKRAENGSADSTNSANEDSAI